MTTRSQMTAAQRVAQVQDWRDRLSRMVGEMEAYYGPPGENNQAMLDAAVHIAFHLAADEVRAEERSRVSYL